MDMDEGGGVLSVPSDHYWGLVALVASPVFLWLVLCAGQALAHRGVPAAVETRRRLSSMPTAARAALVASYVGAVVHFVLVRPHWDEDRTRALLFIVDGAGFVIAFGWTLLQRPYWRAVALLAVGSTVGGYAYYVLNGLEEVDLVGLVTTTIELATVLVLLVPEGAATATPAWARSRERWIVGGAVPLALATVLGTNAIATTTTSEDEAAAGTDTAAHSTLLGRAMDRFAGLGAPGMKGMHGLDMKGMRMSGKPGSSAAATRLSLATRSPAGPIVWPAPMGPMEAGTKMVTPDCTASPTPAQQQAAVRLVDQTVKAVARYRSLAAAKAAGYVPITPSGMRVVHYINYSVYGEGTVLDPSAIPVLVYVNTSHGAVLSAAMYLAPPGEARQPGGCLTQWHVHTNLCFADAVVVALSSAAGCPQGSVRQLTPPMMHVWLTPVPGGPLAMGPSTLAEMVAAERVPALPRHNGTA
jgi:hypothetical protein